MKFYVMYAQSCVAEYAEPGDEINVLEKGCWQSEFQFLDRSPLDVEISENGGAYFPDFILQNSIPLISHGIKKFFDKFQVDYVFYKPIRLTYSKLGRAENYFLALPPRINCLNMSESVFEVEDTENFFPEMTSKTATKIVIDRNKVGNYKIFKLPQFFLNAEIIVTEDLKTALENAELSNVNFIEI